MRFFVSSSPSNGGYDPLPVAQAGFSTCSTPEASIDAVEYKEGHMVYTRKFPGTPTMADITLARGVALKDTLFYDWMFKVIEGGDQYRTDLVITHFHRDALPGYQGLNNPNATAINVAQTPPSNRQYIVQEAFPLRCKIAGDLDATSADVSVAEMDVCYEHFYVQEKAK